MVWNQQFRADPGSAWDPNSQSFIDDANINSISLDDFLGLAPTAGGFGTLNHLLAAGPETLSILEQYAQSPNTDWLVPPTADPNQIQELLNLGIYFDPGADANGIPYGLQRAADQQQIQELLNMRQSMADGNAFGFVGPDGQVFFRERGQDGFNDPLADGTQQIDFGAGMYNPMQMNDPMVDGYLTGGVTPLPNMGGPPTGGVTPLPNGGPGVPWGATGPNGAPSYAYNPAQFSGSQQRYSPMNPFHNQMLANQKVHTALAERRGGSGGPGTGPGAGNSQQNQGQNSIGGRGGGRGSFGSLSSGPDQYGGGAFRNPFQR